MSEKIKQIQTILGTKQDGKWGPKTQAALDAEIDAMTQPDEKVTTTKNEWPLEKDAASFFGYPANLTQIECPYPMRMEDDGNWLKISKITCNIKVAASLRRVFNAIYDGFGKDIAAIKAANADVYDGCFNDRTVRGSTKRSMHAYAAAIDMDAEHNGLGAGKGKMHPIVIKAFKEEGWRWGGDYKGRTDPMHFEACR